MSVYVSLFHSYVSSEDEYRHDSNGALSSICSRNVQSYNQYKSAFLI